MADNKEPNRRKHNRLNLGLAVKLSVSEGRHYEGKTTNISFGGILAHFKDRPAAEVGDDVSISLTFEKVNGERIDLQFSCQVVHKVSDNSICLRFNLVQDIDIESYKQFTSLMILNCSDAEELLEELFNDPVTLISHGGETE